jgi:hypothetical protein
MTANQRTESMTTLCQQRPARGQRACQKPGARVLHFHVTNCTHKLHGHFHEARKIQCNNVSSSVRSQIIDSHFLQIEALPLVKTRFLRLAQISPMAARSPARRQRDGRAISGKIAGRFSRVMSAQLPGNGRTLAAVMPPNVRQDGSQDSLPCAGHGHAMSVPENCETTRNMSAQQPCRSPHNGRRDISQAARRILVVSSYP